MHSGLASFSLGVVGSGQARDMEVAGSIPGRGPTEASGGLTHSYKCYYFFCQ